MRLILKSWVYFFLMLCFLPRPFFAQPDGLVHEIELISEKIFENECSSKPEGLLSWNEGENFASLGIGHFIWYPQGYSGRFTESFPKMMAFLESRGIELPKWYRNLKVKQAPWKTKTDFQKQIRKKRLEFLRNFLIQTKPLQAEFMAERLKKAIPDILDAVPPDSKLEIQQKLSYLIHSQNGLYPLIDYVNFNGEGLNPMERFQGQGWGLLQVLEEMKTPEAGDDVISEFAAAAERVIERRVKNAPKERQEERWLPGWKNRMKTYRDQMPAVRPLILNREMRETLLIHVIQDMPMTQNIFLADLDEMMPAAALPASSAA